MRGSASAESLDLILKWLPAFVVVADTELRFTAIRGAVLRGLGIDDAAITSLIGTPAEEYFTGPGGDEIMKHVRKALQGEAVSFEAEWMGRWFYAHVAPMRSDAGKIIGTVGVGMDISSRHDLQSKLEDERQILQQAQELAELGSWCLDLATDEIVISAQIARCASMRSVMSSIVPTQRSGVPALSHCTCPRERTNRMTPSGRTIRWSISYVPLEMPLLETQERLKGRYRSYIAATDPPEYEELARELEALRNSPQLAFAHRTGGEIGVSAESGTGLAFSINALAHAPVKAAFEKLWLGGQRLAAHDVKTLLHRLHEKGFEPRVFADDTMIGAHLLNPSRTFAEIEDAVQELLALSAGDDAAAHADAVLRLVEKERPQLAERDQLRLYEDVEVPLAPILAKMEWTGVLIDPAELDVLSGEIASAIERLQAEIYELAGEQFNIGSPMQLGNLLFGKLCIPGGKKTKTGWATGVEVLQGLSRDYPICAKVLEYREVTKLKNTYIDVIPSLTDKRDGRLRTIFNQTATATGRLSSTNPNLQNIPVRSDLGRRIRRAFVAPKDEYVLVAADYSQIELRLMAHLSGDAAMRRAFDEGQDIHDFTARQIFNLGPDENVDGNQRRMAKSVNFGLLYGMSDFGLAQRLEIGRAEAKEITTAYFARFPSVRAYIDGVIEQGRKDGFVTTLLGRRRYMPALRSSNYMLRSAAEREATNAPLQGSAADLMKLAMVKIEARLAGAQFDARMLLQIHDELIFEVRRSQMHEVAALVRSEMENAVQLSVPLAVTVKTGENWYDVEERDDV
jgi:DNA polymerase I